MIENAVILLLIGIIGLLMAWFSVYLKDRLLSFPMVMITLGMIIYSLPISLPDPNPVGKESLILHLSEITVIISLMGTGLKLNKDFNLQNYKIPILLVLVTMIGCIATVALLGWMLAGLIPASAYLLGAVFAPTDPVIAEEVQVNFMDTEEPPMQFSLTAEAGINDGMAFPFTWFAVWVASAGLDYSDWIIDWLIFDLLYRIIMGVIVGYGLGKLLGYLLFTLPSRYEIAKIRREFVAIASTFLVYGITELIQGYGFIAVFTTAITLRHVQKEHEFHQQMHNFIDEIEKILLALILVLLGGYTVHYMFDSLTIAGVLLAVGFILIVRPLFGILPLLMVDTEMNLRERCVVAFMGMKGVGSFFYLAFALHETDFAHPDLLWSITGFLVLTSVIVHGASLYIVKSLFPERIK